MQKPFKLLINAFWEMFIKLYKKETVNVVLFFKNEQFNFRKYEHCKRSW